MQMALSWHSFLLFFFHLLFKETGYAISGALLTSF